MNLPEPLHLLQITISVFIVIHHSFWAAAMPPGCIILLLLAIRPMYAGQVLPQPAAFLSRTLRKGKSRTGFLCPAILPLSYLGFLPASFSEAVLLFPAQRSVKRFAFCLRYLFHKFIKASSYHHFCFHHSFHLSFWLAAMQQQPVFLHPFFFHGQRHLDCFSEDK